MAVYVDDSQRRFRGMIMCHMIADTREELLEMVRKVGVGTQHIQDADTEYEHFDICRSNKLLALNFGAVQITKRELIQRCRARRNNATSA